MVVYGCLCFVLVVFVGSLSLSLVVVVSRLFFVGRLLLLVWLGMFQETQFLPNFKQYLVLFQVAVVGVNWLRWPDSVLVDKCGW